MAASRESRQRKKMNKNLNIIIAQQDYLVGDMFGNAEKIISAIKKARNDLNGNLIIFPELAITGYPAEDLLLRPALHERVEEALKQIQSESKGIDVIIGHPHMTDQGCYNAASVIRDQKILTSSFKCHLPNHHLFDEERYFIKGSDPSVVDFNGVKTGILVCEDMWHPEPIRHAVAKGAQLIIVINASPFNANNLTERQRFAEERVKENKVPIIYANLVGGQDEMVFDGGSFVMNANGGISNKAKSFEEELLCVDLEVNDVPNITSSNLAPKLPVTEQIYKALVLGTRDYVVKNGFKEVIVGVSGGIDSAMAITVAVDAIGAENVHAVLMPSRHTSENSNLFAQKLVANLGISHSTYSIEKAFQAFLDTMADRFKDMPHDITEENMQARCRCVILMALSNKNGAIVLNTGNKSEASVGYATLYGDMAGGFSVLADVSKTLVYELANFINSGKEIIPQGIIDRYPTAELAPDQIDQDHLPPYSELDQILDMYIAQDLPVKKIIEAGFNGEEVRQVVRLVDINEYKRRQATPGIRITHRAFGKDRRYPITSGYRKNH